MEILGAITALTVSFFSVYGSFSFFRDLFDHFNQDSIYIDFYIDDMDDIDDYCDYEPRVYISDKEENELNHVSHEFKKQFKTNEDKDTDNVNHPKHYNMYSQEVIVTIGEWVKGLKDGVISYCVGNTLKYLSRCSFKHETPLEDLKKARWYLDYTIKYMEAKDND